MKLFFLFLSISLFSTILFAQHEASVTGRVTQNNLPVPSARVVLNIGSRRVAETSTNSDGYYQFPAFAAGSYTLIISIPGGSRQERQIQLTGGGPTTADFIFTTPLCGTRRNCPTISERVTISADATQPIEEVSKTVSSISAQEMRDRADITLVDSLRTVPGFRVQQLGGFGRAATIKSRGLRNQDTAVLIDGVRLRDPAAITGDASSFLSDLTLTSVSRVEVLRGPGSSLYGTNAVGGTVDFQSPIPRDGWHGQVSGAAGGLGLGRFRGNLSKGFADGKFGFNAALSRTIYTKGIDGNDNASNTNLQSRVEFNPQKRTNISARFFFSDAFVKLNDGPDTAGVPPVSNFGIIKAAKGVNFVFDSDDPDSDQKSRFFNGQVIMTHSINDRLAFQGYYSGLMTRRKNRDGPLGGDFSDLTSIFEGAIHTANGHLEWTPNGTHRITAGYEFELEDFRNEGLTPNGAGDFFTAASQSSNSIYFQELVRLMDGKLQFGGGFRAQFFSVADPAFSLQNAPYTGVALDDPPAAYTFDGSASYFVSSTGTKLRLHAGNGYRAPSLYERLGTFFNTFPSNSFVALGDPYLRPERSAAFDVGIDQYLWDRRITASAVYFYSKLTDVIGYGNVVPDIGSTTRPFGGYLNGTGGVSRGVELSGALKPSAATEIYASYTFTNSDQLIPQITGSGVFATLGVPAHQFTLNATQRIGKFWVNADLVTTNSYLAPVYSNFNFRSYVYRFAGSRRLDVTAGYTFSFDKAKYSLRLFGTVENALDHEYFENGFRTPGVNARAGLSFSF